MPQSRQRIAFALDETLGTPIIDQEGNIIFFLWRQGSLNLLKRLAQRFELVLWSVSSRQYVSKALAFGIAPFFSQTFSWDEMPHSFKDIRLIDATLLIDDNENYRLQAAQHGIENQYLIVPAVGSPADQEDPFAWKRLIEAALDLEQEDSGPDIIKRPDDTQRAGLLELMSFAFVELRNLAGPQSNPEQSFDLAYAFHNLPLLLDSDELNWSQLRRDLREYQRDHRSMLDYVAKLDELLAL